MDVNESTKALTCAGLFLEAVGNDQQEFVQLTMQFTIRAENGGAGALFGTVRNNVQLNETSIDGVFLGGTSGTLFGRVARGSKDPIRVDMINAHYCVIGKVKDTCLPDPAYKESGDDFSAGENDKGTDDNQGDDQFDTDGTETQSVRYLGAKTETDPCCDNSSTDPPVPHPHGRCIIYTDPLSVLQDCPCDMTGDCESLEPVESKCVFSVDTSAAFENKEQKLEVVDHFEKTSVNPRYVFGPEVSLNSSQINVTLPLAMAERIPWSLFK